MAHRGPCIGAALLAVGFCVCRAATGATAAVVAPTPDLDQVIAIAREREQRAESVVCEYVLNERWGPADQTGQRNAPRGQDRATPVSLTIEGHKLRGRIAALPGGPPGAKTGWGFWLLDGVTVDHFEQLASAGIAPRTSDLWAEWVQPVISAYRLFDPVIGLAKPEELTLLGRAQHEGHPCVVVETRVHLSSSDWINNWWLAEDMDYACVRRQSWIRNHPETEVTLQYEPDDAVGWRLTFWYRSHPPQRTWPSDLSITFNETLSPDTFVVELPAGTRVSDGVRNVNYVVGEETPTDEASRLLAAGRMREFVEEVRRQTEEQARPAWRRWIVPGGLVALAVGGSGIILLRRRRRARRA